MVVAIIAEKNLPQFILLRTKKYTQEDNSVYTHTNTKTVKKHLPQTSDNTKTKPTCSGIATLSTPDSSSNAAQLNPWLLLHIPQKFALPLLALVTGLSLSDPSIALLVFIK